VGVRLNASPVVSVPNLHVQVVTSISAPFFSQVSWHDQDTQLHRFLLVKGWVMETYKDVCQDGQDCGNHGSQYTHQGALQEAKKS